MSAPAPVQGDTVAERTEFECARQGIPVAAPMSEDLARWLTAAQLKAAS